MQPVDKFVSNSDDPINRLPIRLRGYVTRPPRQPKDGKDYLEDVGPDPDWVLVFDCETRTTPDQNLTFGAYQLRYRHRIIDSGLFYDPDVVVGTDLKELRIGFEAEKANRPNDFVNLRVREHFVKYVLLRAHGLGALIVGFNLPFDLSRLAIRHGGSAQRGMKGGFSFQVHSWGGHPKVRVKHLSRRMALMDFTQTGGRHGPDSLAERNIAPAPRKGYFLDLKTLSGAFTGQGHTLKSLGKLLGIKNPKTTTETYGLPLDQKQISYGINDVQATWECFVELRRRFDTIALVETPIHRIFSEASLGKAYLKQMNIRPWTEVQPDFSPELIGKIMSAYFGGRAEVRIRRTETEVLYCDFLAMYPTVCRLLRLWDFVIGQGIDWCDDTDLVRNFLDKVTADDLQNQDLWKDLTVLVQVAPDDDVFPVRARYGSDLPGADIPSATIGVNRLTSKHPLWFTLADCIAAKLLSGKIPRIIAAIRFKPKAQQENLKTLNINGNADYAVDPAAEDFYRRLVELRREVKAESAGATGERKAALKSDQLGLKLLANSTSYGIFIELNVEDLDKPERMVCHDFSGQSYEVASDKFEKPGRYFHPLLGVMITGAARLMLGLAEHLVKVEKLDWVFCDTDSLAIARPAAMERADFRAAAIRICDWFKPLNPYDEPNGAERPSILQIEDANYEIGRIGDVDALKPLFAFAVSAKRYALYNIDGGKITLRKASAHGLGQLKAPYPDPDKDDRMDRLGVELWQEDLWLRIVEAARTGHSDRLSHPNSLKTMPAATRFAAALPNTRKWFDGYNSAPGRTDYRDQVKAFNFLLTYQPKSDVRLSADKGGKSERRGKSRMLPASAYHEKAEVAVEEAFDRRTGEPVAPEDLKSVAQSLRLYHRHEERKFWGGDLDEIGATRRRHVRAVTVVTIGKETDGYEEPEADGEDDTTLEYELSDPARADMLSIIADAKERHGVRELRSAARVGDHTINDVLAGKAVDGVVLVKLVEAAERLDRAADQSDMSVDSLLGLARTRVSETTQAAFAREIGESAGNVSRVLSGKKEPYPQLIRKLSQMAIDLGWLSP